MAAETEARSSSSGEDATRAGRGPAARTAARGRHGGRERRFQRPGGGAAVGMMMSGGAASNGGRDGGAFARGGGARTAAPAEAASAATRAVNGVEQRHGGSLSDRSIPDETQQQWTMRRDFDEARRRDGLLEVQQATPRPKTRVSLALPQLYDPDPVAPTLDLTGFYLLGLVILVFDGVQIHSPARGMLHS
ncbi:hypothetical protein Scep_025509 [Stephania cephalantha]|uniref:Uncharacterized protein n=1 Tax=Stephania cephalantha TaxID=152367 RepID=A0AAP0EKW6_9MAGN